LGAGSKIKWNRAKNILKKNAINANPGMMRVVKDEMVEQMAHCDDFWICCLDPWATTK
jgi:hypothetical protein